METTDTSPLLLLYVGVGLFLVLLGLPLMRRRVKPNRVYGFRTRRTLADEQLWYDVNAHHGRCLAWSGGLTALTAVCLMLLPAPDAVDPVLLCLGVLLVCVAGGVVATWRYMKSIDTT